MLNKKEKIVYLLGAGAMIDFGGPATSYLTEECKKKVKDSILKEIIDLLDKTYNKNYNFETIIAAVEYVLDCKIAYEREGVITPQNTSILRALTKLNIDNNVSALDVWNVYNILINYVIGEIKKYDLNGNHSDRTVLKKHFYNIIDKQSVKIYSMNYDKVIYEIFKNRNIDDGTDIVYGRSFRKFNNNIKDFVKSDFTYFNLHGSIYLDTSRGYITQENYPCEYKNIWANFIEGGSPNDKKIFSPMLSEFKPTNYGATTKDGKITVYTKGFIKYMEENVREWQM